MKKTKILLCLLFTIILSVGAVPAMAADAIGVTLNGEKLTFDVAPVNIDGRVMVPMRAIFEALGATVEWYEEDQSIEAENEDAYILMQIGEPIMYVNWEEVTLDVAPQLINDRTMVPIRAVSEAFDAEVAWDAAASTVVIKSAQPIVPDEVVLNETFSVLGGRLSITLPAGFESSELKNAAESTLNFVSLNPKSRKMPLRIIVNEQFEVSSGDIEKDAEIYKKVMTTQGWTLTSKNISDEAKQAVQITPTSFPGQGNYTTYLNSAMMKAADGLLIYVEIDIAKEYFNEKDEWLALSEKILQSIKVGTKKIDRSARKVTIGNYTLELPENYSYSMESYTNTFTSQEEKYYSIQKINTFSDKIAPLISVEISEEPWFNYEFNEIQEITKNLDKINGQSIFWSSYTDQRGERNLSAAETIFPIPGNDQLMVKVLALAETEAELEALKEIARTLTLVK
ncbi:MAG: copper amine oxidase N-terminal domain-containing protein [Clostridiales bacterium]|jgi:hypothetical protein|nr:copper amine oxidase N-terminal domain-containing protein [Clostridiales bacterium]